MYHVPFQVNSRGASAGGISLQLTGLHTVAIDGDAPHSLILDNKPGYILSFERIVRDIVFTLFLLLCDSAQTSR